MALRTLALLAGCMLVGVTACSDEPDVISGPGATSPGAGVTSAQLDGRSFTGTDVVGHELVDGTAVTLTFEDGRLSTNAGCNTSSGAYRVDDGVLRIEGDRATTLIGCEAELEAQDQWLGQFLADGPAVELVDDLLTLDGGEVTMTLTSGGADPAALVGPTWMLNAVIEGETASSVPAGVEQPTLRIGEDGMAELFTGCNRGGAAAGTTTTEERGDLLTFGPIRLTKMACGEDAMALEATVLAVLESDPAMTLTADGLVLTAPDGTGLDFRAA
jgi:heat shock protein HslJ